MPQAPSTDTPTPPILAELGRELLSLADDDLAALLATLDGEDLATAEAAIAQAEREVILGAEAAAEWRRTPATMANRLTRGERRLWRYVQLLADRFSSAFQMVLPEDERDPTMVCRPRQIINMPSQMGKTTALMDGAVWALDHNPRLRIMYITYDADKAVEEGGSARDMAEQHSADLRFELRGDRRARGMWRTDSGGGLYAVGVNGGIVGWAADAILIDDLLKGWVEAHSEAARDRVMNIYRSQIRLRVQSTWTPIVYATTRWHEDDPPARLKADEEKNPHADRWFVTRIPAIAEEPDPQAKDPLLRLPDPLGRAPGEVIEPERFPLEEVLARHATLGGYLTAAMEQQRPAPVEGTEIKRDWWRLDDDVPVNFDELISSWDMKLKDKESGDFVVGGTWGRNGSHYWLTSVQRGQWNQPTTENAIALAGVREPRISVHVVENTGNGPEVIESLRAGHGDYVVSDEVAGLLGMTEEERAGVQRLRRVGMSNIIPETVKGSKIVRMRSQSGLIEGRTVHLWKYAPWLATYLEEMSQFPNGSHDDQVDMTSQALKRLRHGGAEVSVPTGTVQTPPPGQVGRGAAVVTAGPVGNGRRLPIPPGVGGQPRVT